MLRRWRKRHFRITILAVAAFALVLAILAAAFYRSRAEIWSWRRLAAVVGVSLPPPLTHEQEVWLHALEWCESRGVKTAINPKDLDGTPSYYSFQFKPSTFKRYGIKYGIFDEGVTATETAEKIDDYELQKRIVSHMIDDSEINWRREFPDCVRRLGRPPVKS